MPQEGMTCQKGNPAGLPGCEEVWCPVMLPANPSEEAVLLGSIVQWLEAKWALGPTSLVPISAPLLSRHQALDKLLCFSVTQFSNQRGMIIPASEHCEALIKWCM